MLNITSETDKDIGKIRSCITAAFGEIKVAELVDKIRDSLNFIPELSLVAKENEQVLGHILFSRILIEAPKQIFPALALAPLAVIPSHQRRGIGSKLVEIGLSKCRELDHFIIVVVGDPRYYQRFGFQTASKFGLQSSLLFPDEVFMVSLKSNLINISGIVRYPTYFSQV